MTELQVISFVTAMAVLTAVTLAVQFGWMGSGKVKTVLVFLSGIAVIVALRVGGLPPSWFAGTAASFALAVSLTATAFIGRGDARSFQLPLFLGLGLALLITNLAQFVRNIY